ncbi:hypothetical protein ASG35_21500 [Burkholderia sp. Leaf177]|uniref:hypothetical protein n=1 Tax=Burkholderia sp. Leaf177 TaxID=1736287 RepID=UPI0006FDB68A|nr:hypothetical protein [Burkholderia sp. Leaf177]KQR74338.1 hypothetical protein ASG35_21500 [Burkholderia sp. Leaf177]
MKRTKLSQIFQFSILFAICLLMFPELLAAKEKMYRSKGCPVIFTVPNSMSLHDVDGWTEPAQHTACRISLIWKNVTKSPVPEKSFDDVRLLSDIVLDVKNVPLKDRFDGLHFSSLPDRVIYKGPELSADARSMGYKLMRTRPIEHFPVKNGEMYVGIQDFIEVDGPKMQRRQSVSYVFLIGNGTHSIDVQATFDKNRKSDAEKINSLLKLLRSSSFQSEAAE